MRKLRSIVFTVLIAVLLFKLALQISLAPDWQQPITAVIYPINADGRFDTSQYIQALSVEHFEEIAQFVNREAARYKVPIAEPVQLTLGQPLASSPPLFPVQGSSAEHLNWSIRSRFWRWWNLSESVADIHIYMRFFSPHHRRQLAHSLGLKQGMIGLVNGYAAIDLQAQNNFVVAHELLHTLGASDKYDLNTQLPLFPQGYAQPERQPRFPQRQAEIMGGRIPVTVGFAVMPRGLGQAVVGTETAREIGWH